MNARQNEHSVSSYWKQQVETRKKVTEHTVKKAKTDENGYRSQESENSHFQVKRANIPNKTMDGIWN